MLTAEQIDHFQTFGFLMLRGLFSQIEAEAIRVESDKVMSIESDTPFNGKSSQSLFQLFERSQMLMSLLEDDRIHGIAESLLGPDFILMSTEGNRQVTGNDEPAINANPIWRLVCTISTAQGQFHDRCLSLNTGTTRPLAVNTSTTC